jgi:hypothetical protein
MASHQVPDQPRPSNHPDRHGDEIELDDFADKPLGTTELHQWLYGLAEVNYFPSPQELQRLSCDRVRVILEKWELLSNFLQRHEGTLHKRWLKMTKAKRKEILLAVDSTIPCEHRPDMLELYQLEDIDQSNEIFNAEMKFLSALPACLVPQINLEDLLEPNSLLVFLNSRGRNHPKIFAHTELVTGPLCNWAEQQFCTHLKQWKMGFTGSLAGDSYGRMKEYRSSREAERAISGGREYHPGQGIRIINAQFAIYEFLYGCCTIILGGSRGISTCNISEDVFARTYLNDISFPILPEPPKLAPGNITSDKPYKALQAAPYLVPAQLDFTRLRTLIASKVADLEDHIWALREDPEYFADVYMEHKTHRSEFIPSIDGQEHFVAKQPPHVMAQYILRNVLIEPYFLIYYWQECLRIVDALESTANQHDYVFDQSRSLPMSYYNDLEKLWKVLYVIHTDVHEYFRQRIPCAPLMRKYFVKVYADPFSHAVRYVINDGNIVDPDVRRFFKILTRVWMLSNPPKQGFVLELDMMDRLAQQKSTVKELLSPFCWEYFSHLSTSAECIQQIRSYRPWATQMEQDILHIGPNTPDIFSKDTEDYYAKLTAKWGSAVRLKKLDDKELLRLADPSDGKFDYPVKERRNRTNTKSLRYAEESLDIFWKAADTYCKRVTGASFPKLLHNDIVHGRKLRRTPACVDPPRSRKSDIPTQVLHPEYVYRPFSLFDHHDTSQITGYFDRLAIATQPNQKTRGNTQDVGDQDDGNEGLLDNANLPKQKASIGVDRRAYRVFKALFHTPFTNDTPAEVQWSDFLHAMVKGGLSVEKMHGSAWKLSLGSGAMEHAIQFHEPHPDSKLPLSLARRYGRRLERAYSWTGDSFRLG